MRAATGTSGALRRLGLLLLFWRFGACQQEHMLHLFNSPTLASSNTLGSSSSSSSSSSRFSDLNIPRDPVFDDPWVQQNIALVYGHQVQDGVGSQTMRMIAVYALAMATGVRHLFRPLGCVGHIGGHVHYRDAACNFTDESDIRQLKKTQHMIQLPSTITEQETYLWDKKFDGSLDWGPFVRDVAAAARDKRPTLFEVERVNGLIRHHPDLFMTIPALRPSNPAAALACRLPDRQHKPGGISHSKAWLLDALRVAIHVRRGDVITDGWVRRVLDTKYYVNLAKTLSNVLEGIGCDYSMEVYIEAPRTPEGVEELKVLQQQIPNAVLLVETDMLWTWQMMATADILVMSNSMFSLSAGLINPNALTIHVPYKHYTNRVGQFKLSHWLTPLDDAGVLPGDAIEEIKRRAGYQPTQQQEADQQQQLQQQQV